MPAFYTRLEGAEMLRFQDGTKVQSPHQYCIWHAEKIFERGIAKIWICLEVIHAHVNHGRWLAICTACKTPMLTHPEWKLACCTTCGARYGNVIFPDTEIVQVLCERPIIETQNWFPGETAQDLLAENVAHGLERT